MPNLLGAGVTCGSGVGGERRAGVLREAEGGIPTWVCVERRVKGTRERKEEEPETWREARPGEKAEDVVWPQCEPVLSPLCRHV